MVIVKYVDGTEDAFETKLGTAPWKYNKVAQCFIIPSINGNVIIPASFIKCLRHYEAEE